MGDFEYGRRYEPASPIMSERAALAVERANFGRVETPSGDEGGGWDDERGNDSKAVC